MKNKKEKISLIALLSCVLVVSIAFAAYTGYLTIKGTASVMGNPFKMVFADQTSSSQTTEINATNCTTLNGDAEASNITVSADGKTIESFNVKLYKTGDSAKYRFLIQNIGGSTAYLESVNIAETTNGDAAIAGLNYSFTIEDMVDSSKSFVATSSNGASADVLPNGGSGQKHISVDAGGSVLCYLNVEAGSDELFKESSNVDLTLGAITINWTSVNPNQSA